MKVLKRSKAYEKFSPTKIAFAIKNASEGLLTDDECSTVTDRYAVSYITYLLQSLL